MSWFDGRIPQKCAPCFVKQGAHWVWKEPYSCDDSCEYFLHMYPVLNAQGRIDHEKMDILSQATRDPVWHSLE